jgi:hypothetical protein
MGLLLKIRRRVIGDFQDRVNDRSPVILPEFVAFDRVVALVRRLLARFAVRLGRVRAVGLNGFDERQLAAATRHHGPEQDHGKDGRDAALGNKTGGTDAPILAQRYRRPLHVSVTYG